MLFDFHSHIKYDYNTCKYDIEGLIQDTKDNQIDQRMISALYGQSISSQNDTIRDIVQQFPNVFVGCMVLNPKDKDCIQEMDRCIQMNCFKAIELDSMEHNYTPESLSAIIDIIISKAIKHKLVVNVFTGFGCRTMPAQWAYYAKRFPDVKMVFLHMGTTDFGYGCVELVLHLPNVYIETSCMYELPILKKAFTNIEATKFLFGSHYPHKITTCSIHTFDLLHLSEETRQALFYDNACKLLNQ